MDEDYVDCNCCKGKICHNCKIKYFCSACGEQVCDDCGYNSEFEDCGCQQTSTTDE